MKEPVLEGPIWLMQPIPYFGEELSGEWIYEPKIDGWRIQIIRFSDGRVELWGRRLEREPNWTFKLSFLVEAAQTMIPTATLLDGELSTAKGRRFMPSLFAAKRKVEPRVYIFDIIFHQGQFVGYLSLKERRRLLESLPLRAPFQLVEAKPVRDLESHLKEALQKEEEGIVIKDLASPYLVAQDGPIATEHWRKIK